MRNKIKMFAHQQVTLPPGRHKIIVLDEADRLVIFLYFLKFVLVGIADYFSFPLRFLL